MSQPALSQPAQLDADRLVVLLGGRTVLHGLSHRFAPGRLTAIIGPNGVGKSTLQRTLVGLLAPHVGVVSLDGAPIHSLPPLERARRIGYLPQDRTVHWPLPVRDVVSLGRLPHRLPGHPLSVADQRAIAAAMTILDLDALADRPITALSGGERARVLLARVLAGTPEILIADEPASSLDPAHQLRLFQELRASADRGMTVITALHDLSAAARFADVVLLINPDGTTVSGPPAAIITPANLATAFNLEGTLLVAEGIPIVVPTRVIG